MQALLIEGDQLLAEMLTYLLRQRGFSVAHAGDGEQAIRLWQRISPDVVILDVRLPKISGWQICARIRQESEVPLVILSGAASEEDVIRGLELGADDYIAKPFNPGVLMARLRAVLRRSMHQRSAARPAIVEAGPLVLDPERREVRRAGQPVRLTKTEFNLLLELVRHPNQVLAPSTLLDRVWGFRDAPDQSALKTHIHHLRQKIEPEPQRPRWILTVPGAGYTFRMESEPISARPVDSAREEAFAVA